jgi:nitroimidazol reductase NimA-like FMN-containing flavoprotein (pyridoxamine 5'-phosphate oxidase superfamily)
MSLYSDKIFLIPGQPILFVSFSLILRANVIVLSLTGQGLEPTIYRFRGEHANHYTTNVARKWLEIAEKLLKVALNIMSLNLTVCY